MLLKQLLAIEKAKRRAAADITKAKNDARHAFIEAVRAIIDTELSSLEEPLQMRNYGDPFALKIEGPRITASISAYIATPGHYLRAEMIHDAPSPMCRVYTTSDSTTRGTEHYRGASVQEAAEAFLATLVTYADIRQPYDEEKKDNEK